ncbi:sensor histidine kinase [Ferruginibacter albus]|uniref:sensor histidine kinase n=1 Tax=Ferruginibacter albus TaxID=2875540 RepID=UPI001CC7A4FD|nr:ATP-binding protein [Ferruginibacter albus]UAY51464.1 DUF4118 domain-containing protein [Ferruginibacter albus]
MSKISGVLLLMNSLPKRKQYLFSILIICFVSAICFAGKSFIGFEVVAFILLVTLSIIAMFFDILPVLLAAFLSALIWDFFFLTPRYNLQVGTTEDKIMLLMYFVIVLVNAGLTSKIRQVEKQAREKEEKAQTLKLYNTLLNSLSHELRTPVSIIIAATDNLSGGSPQLSEKDKENLVLEISKASLRLNLQVENLLNMSRLESGFLKPKKDWCDINELVYTIIDRYNEEFKGHNLQVRIPENFPLFKVDHGLLEHVIHNLVNNAAQYTPEGSLIMISAENIQDTLMIIIEDNGNGFPEEEREKVFEKFYRLKDSKTGGTGLGLSIVKGFVEAHNGTVELKKSDLGGAKFIVQIPMQESSFKYLLNE